MLLFGCSFFFFFLMGEMVFLKMKLIPNSEVHVSKCVLPAFNLVGSCLIIWLNYLFYT